MSAVDGRSIVQLLSVLDLKGSRDGAVHRLQQIVPTMQQRNKNLKTRLYQVIPTFLIYFIMRKEEMKALNLIQVVMEHESDKRYRNLLAKWVRYIQQAEQKSHTYPVAKDFRNLLAYEDIEFFVNLCRYLKEEKKLYKYVYFFGNITYLEFLSINAIELVTLETKMGLLPITNGARGAILSMAQELDGRVTMLRAYAKGPIEDFETFHRHVAEIMKTPLRRADHLICAKEEITFLLVSCVRKLSSVAKSLSEREKTRALLERALSMHYVFNRSQRHELKNIRQNFLNRTSNLCEQKLPEETINPQRVTIPRIFREAEIQKGFEQAVFFLENLLKDD